MLPLLRPPSWPWLLAHELRMLWRSFGIRSRIIAGLAIAFLLLAHVAGYFMAKAHALDILVARQPGSAIAMSLFVILLVLSSAFGLAVRVLLERGDIEMLMTAPVPMTAIYAVRALTVAVAAVASIGLFILPLANMGPFAGEWRLLAAWPALASLGLVSAALAFAVTLTLVRWLGLRRARVAAQLVGAFIGIGFILLMQLGNLLPRARRAALQAWMGRHDDWFGSASPLLWPLRAFLGDPWTLLPAMAIGVGLFAWVVRGTQATFLLALQDAPVEPRRRGAGRDRPFRAGLARVVFAKELTLIARDPALIARALLPFLYLLPLFVIVVQRSQPPSVLAAALVMLSASLASTLAWITVSGEQAPDLVASAPVDVQVIRWLKVAAALVPVLLAVAPFIAWFAYGSLRTAGIAAAYLVLALASSAVVQVWSTPLGGGRDIRKRWRQSPLVSITDTLCSFAWAGACWLAFAGSPWTFAAMALACVAPVTAWLAARSDVP